VAAPRTVPLPREQVAETHVVRFDQHQRVQHVLMMSSFIVLALTGLPQKFGDLALSQWWVSTLGGLETVRWIHRSAGFVMLSDCLYHLCYLGYRMGVQRQLGPLRMVPGPKDLRDVVQTMLHFLGVAPEKPKFDRFSYLEKFDYWAVFWGIAMIGGSGLVLMFPVRATGFLPGQANPAALAIHSDEAVLAVGWILAMHMFNAHLAPWIFPFNSSIFTGRVSARRYALEHPLEWARIASDGRVPEPLPAQTPAAEPLAAATAQDAAPVLRPRSVDGQLGERPAPRLGEPAPTLEPPLVGGDG
jgi:cytochrome b subunit of formate dehydrogenase